MKHCRGLMAALMVLALSIATFHADAFAAQPKETWIFVSNEENGTRIFTQKEAAFYDGGNGSGIVRIENSAKEVYVLYRIEFKSREDGGYSVTIADGSLYDYDGTLIEKDGNLTRQQSGIGSNLWKVCRTIQSIVHPPKRPEAKQ